MSTCWSWGCWWPCSSSSWCRVKGWPPSPGCPSPVHHRRCALQVRAAEVAPSSRRGDHAGRASAVGSAHCARASPRCRHEVRSRPPLPSRTRKSCRRCRLPPPQRRRPRPKPLQKADCEDAACFSNLRGRRDRFETPDCGAQARSGHRHEHSPRLLDENLGVSGIFHACC